MRHYFVKSSLLVLISLVSVLSGYSDETHKTSEYDYQLNCRKGQVNLDKKEYEKSLKYLPKSLVLVQ